MVFQLIPYGIFTAVTVGNLIACKKEMRWEPRIGKLVTKNGTGKLGTKNGNRKTGI